MSGRLTLWGASQLLGAYIGRGVQPPESLYLALIRDVAPTAFVSGSELDEPSPASYLRAEIANDSIRWATVGSLNEISTTEDVVFMTAHEDWGVIRHWALCDSPEAGNVIATGAFSVPVLVNSGSQVKIPDGSLSFTIGPFYGETI